MYSCSERLSILTSMAWSLQVQRDFNRDKYFDAKEAQEYGIIDHIIRPPRSLRMGV